MRMLRFEALLRRPMGSCTTHPVLTASGLLSLKLELTLKTRTKVEEYNALGIIDECLWYCNI